MVISLLDRWRKASYLESMDGETDLFHDEIALNLFQIVELLANSLGKEFKKGLLKKTENLLENYYRDCYNTEMQEKEIVRNVKKSVESILLENSYTLAKKLKYFLECHNLLDQDVSDFVDDVINIRNSVAHGREINQKNFMWPLPAFFNLIKDSYEVVAILKALAAEMMGQYIGTNRWSGEWQTIRQLLPLSKITMEKFFNNNISGEIINRVSLIEGNKYNIT